MERLADVATSPVITQYLHSIHNCGYSKNDLVIRTWKNYSVYLKDTQGHIRWNWDLPLLPWHIMCHEACLVHRHVVILEQISGNWDEDTHCMGCRDILVLSVTHLESGAVLGTLEMRTRWSSVRVHHQSKVRTDLLFPWSFLIIVSGMLSTIWLAVSQP